MDKESLAEKFNQLAPQWEKYVEKYEYKPVFVWLSGLCESQLPSIPRNGDKIHIADLACGIGLIGRCLVNSGSLPVPAVLSGIDISSGMLKRALETKIYNGGVFIQDMDYTALPFQDHSISLVTFCGATELMKDLDYIIGEISRVLLPNGQAWITFQSSEVHSDSTAHQSIHGVSQEYVYDLLERHGLAVSQCLLEPRSFVTPLSRDETSPVPYYFVQAKKMS